LDIGYQRGGWSITWRGGKRCDHPTARPLAGLPGSQTIQRDAANVGTYRQQYTGDIGNRRDR